MSQPIGAEPIEPIPETSLAERVVADVLAPGGEVVLETYGSRLAADAPAIEVHEPGDRRDRSTLPCVRGGYPGTR